MKSSHKNHPEKHNKEHEHKDKKNKEKAHEDEKNQSKEEENKEDNDKKITKENEKDHPKEQENKEEKEKNHLKEDHNKNKKHTNKQEQKNDKKQPLKTKQFDIRNRCKLMFSIVNNQDKEKLYTYHSSDEKHELVNLRQQMANCLNTTKFNKNAADPGPFKPNSAGDCKINISCTTAIECARKMHENNLNRIAVMNFANPHCPGGPYEKGKVTQETCIVSQTLLIGSLLTQSARPFYSDKYAHKDKSKNKGNADYLNNGLIYSPMVPVVTDNDGKFYNENDVFYVDVISVSPIILPKKSHHKDKKKHHDDSQYVALQNKAIPIMEKKIRDTIFMAASVKADGLILGAFGCGSVGNDPRVISKIFHKILIEDGYAGHFKQIDFAIIGKEAVNAFHSCFENYLQNNDQEALPVDVKDEEESIQESSTSSNDSDYSDSDSDDDKTPKNDDAKKDDSKNDDKNTKNNDDKTSKNDDNEEPDIC